ncbi:MBL fold metallo-hydrolase [Bisgaard Taxon 10/6]|uniref:MBL fold metallo-hydrolase n=1 Tax=Exercitatus varius TaxID=67857 RepID=UPI00294AFA20|nr:MBL fold metallo-hydrolase [Exercitatus varius]MDG2947973.1 MBL fold metallo-hydrolase [Exercitatus varius]MDG2955316.1 MBL fold metallo-hydrolase [Exercitatus varius]MDG2962863.1 MBL fold metallo-hydrolase [Exercitatus varius]MDG2963598.1 MBL fold metallo-hydrolase [Exercitatus varius]
MKLKSLIFALMATTVATTANAEISYQHIRNATAKIEMAGSTFLVDPYLAPKGSYAGFEGTINSQKRNPLIDMKEPVEKVLEGVDAVIVTHTHADHWDEYAQKVLPKTLPIFVQNAGDARIIRSQGFKDVRVVGKNTEFNQVKLSKTGGQHGTDQMYAIPQLAELAGEAMGVVMQADGEKTLYIVGDTIWNEDVDFALNRYKPEVIVMNTGYAQLQGFSDSIIMGKADVAKARQAAPKADIITVHMDAVNHAAVTSDEMRKFVKENKLSKVAVPKEGEVLKY